MNTIRRDGSSCFVCGPDNPDGMQLQFFLEGDVCCGDFTPAPHMIGYDNLVHGGIIFAVLDDAMANWLFLKGVRAHTAKCEIRYREPVHLGCTLRLETTATAVKRRMVTMEGRAIRIDDGKVVAETTAAFMIVEGSLKA